MAEVVDEKEHQDAVELLERQYQRLFMSEDGLVVLGDLAKHCYIQASTYVAGCTDAMLINEGARRIFLYIAQKVRMELTEAYLKRDKEAAKTA